VAGLQDINEQYGRAEGDRVVRDAATILRATFRETDVLARMGGERFTILLRDGAPSCTDRARRRLAEHLDDYNVSLGQPFQISIRLGFWRQVPSQAETVENLLLSADAALRSADPGDSINARAS
jgi:diguanylate cyclase (GGDEF)-like protein